MYLQSGTRISGLMIHEMVGKGAMGEVYRGEQIALRRPVAIKRIPTYLADNDDLIARFEREACLVATLKSPHVVAVHDFDYYTDEHSQKHALLVMEWVEGGRNLSQVIAKDQALSWQAATALIRDVCRGLKVAHSQSIIHRDIKPDNILLSGDGRAKLADFGLAAGADATAMTQAGTIIGTPDYMPPEACEGYNVEAPGDIYSLGATWFHLLTGRPPFIANKAIAILRAHCDTPAPYVRDLIPEIPIPIANLIAQCLNKSPQERPASAKVLLEKIENLENIGISLPETCTYLNAGFTTRVSRPRSTVSPYGALEVQSSPSATAVTVISSAEIPIPVIPQTSHPQTHSRSLWAIIILLTVMVIGTSTSLIIVIWPDPLTEKKQEIHTALNVGNTGHALTLADRLVLTYPSVDSVYETVLRVVEQEITTLIQQERFDEAISTVAQRKRERPWISADNLDRFAHISKATYLMNNQQWDTAEEIYRQALDRYPNATDIRHAQLVLFQSKEPAGLHQESIDTALRLTELEPGPLAPLVGDTLLSGARHLGIDHSETQPILTILTDRYQTSTVDAAHEWLKSDKYSDRLIGYHVLSQTDTLTDAESIHFHSWVLFHWSPDHPEHADQWGKTFTWLSQEISTSNWKERLAASGYQAPPIGPAVLKQLDDSKTATAILTSIGTGYSEQVASVLPQWIHHKHYLTRWNAMRLAHHLNLPDLVDPDHFHHRILTDYNRKHLPAAVIESISYFTNHKNDTQAIESLKAGKVFIEDFINNVKNPHRKNAAIEARTILTLIDEALQKRSNIATTG